MWGTPTRIALKLPSACTLSTHATHKQCKRARCIILIQDFGEFCSFGALVASTGWAIHSQFRKKGGSHGASLTLSCLLCICTAQQHWCQSAIQSCDWPSVSFLPKHRCDSSSIRAATCVVLVRLATCNGSSQISTSLVPFSNCCLVRAMNGFRNIVHGIVM